MRLLIGKSILRREFDGAISEEAREILRRAVKPTLLIPIKAIGTPPRTRLLKGYATSSSGPKRLVFLLIVEKEDLFLLFYRPKGDKIGDNISIKNPAFKRALLTYLALLRQDIETGGIEEIPLTPQ